MYALTEADKADDGKYYVWKPKVLVAEVNNVNFPDPVFRSYVSTELDTDSDGYLSETEIKAAKTIDVSGTTGDGGITSLTGIEYLTSMTELNCRMNSGLTSVDLSKNTELTKLDCDLTGLTSLDLSANTVLTILVCDECPLTELDLSNNTSLSKLACGGLNITKLDLSANTKLTLLYCNANGLAYVDVTGLTRLTTFDASNNKYVIPSNAATFDLSAIDGFDASRATDWTNCTYDSATNTLTNITGDVTYTYDCGQGYSETFTLTRTG